MNELQDQIKYERILSKMECGERVTDTELKFFIRFAELRIPMYENSIFIIERLGVMQLRLFVHTAKSQLHYREEKRRQMDAAKESYS